jgi:Tol biopolymer transport system component
MNSTARYIARLVAVTLIAAGCAAANAPANSPSVGSTGASPPRDSPSSAASTAGSSTPSAASPTPPLPPGQIVFDRFDSNFGPEGPYLGTFIARPDGSAPRRISVPVVVDALNAVWSPDGSRLLLSIFHPPPGLGRPAIIDADGTGYALIEPKGLDESLGCSDWSPDGRTLLCSIGSGTHHELDGIYTIRLDGSQLTRLTTSPFHDTVGTTGECGGGENRGVYSPDGAKIAFVRQKCGAGPDPSSDESGAIEVMRNDGTGLREIVPQGNAMSHPGSQISWSSDGTEIAFGSQEGELFLVHPDGTGLTQIPLPTDVGRHHAYGPSWSPDGTRIVFSMYLRSADSTDLYTISPDGSNMTKITADAGAEALVNWGPAVVR